MLTVPCGQCGDWIESSAGFGASVARCDACGLVTVYSGDASTGDDVTACLPAARVDAVASDVLGRFKGMAGTAGTKAGHQRAVLVALAAATT